MTVVRPNFRPSIRERLEAKARAKPAAKKRPGMSEKHLALIRQLPCCVSGKRECVEAHHLKAGLAHERGIGRRSTDRWAVPLSHDKHMELERLGSSREPQWFKDHGIEDPLELANALWQNTGDLDRMRKVLAVHMGFRRVR